MRIQADFVTLASIACASLVSAATIPRAANSTDVALPRIPRPINRSASVSKEILQFILQFSGTGTCSSDRDASVQADGYLTFQYLDDSNPYHYSSYLCQGFCMITTDCAFVNLYYEHNNEGETTLKCALYNQVQLASSKTNWGRQQLLPEPAGLSYIQYSSGWSAFDFITYEGRGAAPPASPVEVPGFKQVLDLDDGIMNVGPGHMDEIVMAEYDTHACADLCLTTPRDPYYGECKYFNIVAYESNFYDVGMYFCNLHSIAPTEEYLQYTSPWDPFQYSATRSYVRQ